MTSSVSCMNASELCLLCLFERFEAGRKQSHGIVAMKNTRASVFGKCLQQPLGLVRHTARPRQTSYDLSFVMSDGELVERAHRARDEDDDVARAHQHDITTLEAEARIDD